MDEKFEYFMLETNKKLEAIESKIDDLMGYRNRASGMAIITTGLGSAVISALVAVFIHYALNPH